MRAISTALIACALACVMHAPIAEAQTVTVLYSFCSSGVSGGCADGAFPYAGLTDVNGVLYGTTYWGGAGFRYCDGGSLSLACGTVFSFDPQTDTETVVYSLCSQKSRRRVCVDGKEPESGVIDVDGMLYGTTEWGGYYGYGTVFSLDQTTDAETILYSFSDKHRDYANGAFPNADPVELNGLLYGTTPFGGRHAGAGTAFSLDLATGVETTLHTFSAKHKDGRGPQAGMIDIKGMLYGTTEYGGKNNAGAVFSLDPTTGAEAVVYSFRGYPS
ncbi:MAG TPA: choice-of-anchor tandem repeat GloVer-containing protein, partial [Rhizomicrobium sp.]|nr:choice-of-anchor tandem repeat GloVer-containing protein [Rhizomicrobium sp.]